MSVLTDQEIADLVAGTLHELGRMRFQQIAQELQDYEVMSKWLKKDKVAVDSGIGIQRTLMSKLPDAARHVGMYSVDDTDVVDLLEQMQVPWRHAETSWAFARQETLMNRGKALVVNIVKPRRAGAMINLAEELEDKAWSCPSATDKKLPYGIPYWVVASSTPTPGFNGGAAYGHTTCAGVNCDETPSFKNYTGQYAAVTKADLIKKLRTMHRKIRWKSPVSVRDYRSGKGDRYRMYVDETVIGLLEDIGESQNENLGRDIASMDGQIVFRRHPIIWVPKLDNHSLTDDGGTSIYNPVFLVDHSTFYPVVLKGDFLREGSPRMRGDAHNVFTTHVDLTYNYVDVDRRRSGVLHATSAVA